MSNKIPDYPVFASVELGMRDFLHARLSSLSPAISEFTFANIYLFRGTHNYSVSLLRSGDPVIAGNDKGESFFMLPFGLPEEGTLEDLFNKFSFMKCVAEEYARKLEGLGYRCDEDPDNFDYLYSTDELSHLSGRKFHRKKNLVNFFTWRYEHGEEPLIEVHMDDARAVLEAWKENQDGHGDYEAAKEALTLCENLQLCGSIYYVEGRPAAYVMGEELNPATFVIHFEKGVPGIKGLLQFVNMHFSSLLPERYRFVNREQDLGEEGLRKAKESWRPVARIKKYKARKG